MAKYIPKITEQAFLYNPNEQVEEVVSYASKALRAKIIADRNLRGFKKADLDGGINSYEFEKQGSPKTYRENIGPENNNNNQGYVNEPRRSSIVPPEKEYISIVDLDYKPHDHDATKFYDKLNLPFVPVELDYRPDSSFVGIASFGRNNPFYQFTGSEDTLTFNIDWYTNRQDRQDVIFNCRWVEALTKGNGYNETPHRIKLVWGKNNLLWADSVWQVVAAPYRLKEFNRGYKDRSNNFVSTNMLPQAAMQNVTLKRITQDNTSFRDIMGAASPGSSQYNLI